jgi:hypothetical protein
MGRIASAVRRGDHLQKAKDQSFRFRKDLGLPNQVCLFRRIQNTIHTRACEPIALRVVEDYNYPFRHQGPGRSPQAAWVDVDRSGDPFDHIACAS